MPFGFVANISHFTERAGVGVSNDDIRRALNQTLDYAHHLGASFARAKDDFRKTLSRRSRMIDAGETDILVVKVANLLSRGAELDFALLVSSQKLFNFA